MLDFTTNYKLKKPTIEEFVNIKDINDNFEDVDKQLNVIEERSDKICMQLDEKVKIGADYRPNVLANGDFKSWSKGIYFDRSSINGEFICADYWYCFKEGYAKGLIVSKDNLSIKIGNTNAAPAIISQLISAVDGSKYKGKTVTMSAKIKANTSINARLFINYNPNKEAYPGAGVAGAGGINTNISTEYSIVQLTCLIPQDAMGLEIGISFCAQAVVNIEWIKFEENDHATPFIPLGYYEEQIKSGLAITKTSGDIIYYISPTGNDIIGDGSPSKPFETIQHAIDLLPQVINHHVTIQLINGTYTTTPYFRGFSGRGSVNINGAITNNTDDADSFILSDGMYVGFCSVLIAIQGIKFKTSVGTGSALSIVSTNSTDITYCKFDGSPRAALYGNLGLVVSHSNARISYSDFSNFTSLSYAYAMYASLASILYSELNTGVNNTHALIAQNGSKIGKYKTQPRGLQGSNSGGEITGSTETGILMFSAGNYYANGNMEKNKVNGNHVHFRYMVTSNSTQNGNASYHMLTLINYLPSSESAECGVCYIYDSYGIQKVMAAYINPDGKIYVEGPITNGWQYRFMFDYITD